MNNKFEIISPTVNILTPLSEISLFPKRIELCGRVCYKSENKISNDSYKTFILNIIKRGHESVLEHCSITCMFTISRSCSHQLVRHRLASFSQESQRYINYKNKKVKIILPEELQNKEIYDNINKSIEMYEKLINNNVKPEDARYVFPNCIATDVVVSCNIREWRHIMKTRMNKAAQWEIRKVITELYNQLSEVAYPLFDNINI